MPNDNDNIDSYLIRLFNSAITRNIDNDIINTAAQIAYNTVKERVSTSKKLNEFVAEISYPIGVTKSSCIAIYELLSSGIKASQRFTDSGINEMLTYSISETKRMRTDEQITEFGMSWYSKDMDQNKAMNEALYALFHSQTCLFVLLNVFCNINTYFNDNEKNHIYSNSSITTHTLMKAVFTNAQSYVDKYYADNR